MKIGIMAVIVSLSICSAFAGIEGFLTSIENTRRVMVAEVVDGETRYLADAVGRRRAVFFDVYPGMIREVWSTEGTWVDTTVTWDSGTYSTNAYFSRYTSFNNLCTYVTSYGIVWTAPELYSEIDTVTPTIPSVFENTQVYPKRSTSWVSGTYQF